MIRCLDKLISSGILLVIADSGSVLCESLASSVPGR